MQRMKNELEVITPSGENFHGSEHRCCGSIRRASSLALGLQIKEGFLEEVAFKLKAKRPVFSQIDSGPSGWEYSKAVRKSFRWLEIRVEKESKGEN